MRLPRKILAFLIVFLCSSAPWTRAVAQDELAGAYMITTEPSVYYSSGGADFDRINNVLGLSITSTLTSDADNLYISAMTSEPSIADTSRDFSVLNQHYTTGSSADRMEVYCDNIFFLTGTSGSTQLRYVNKNTSATVLLLDEIDGANDLAVSPSHVYYVIGQTLYRVDHLGLSKEAVIVTTQLNPTIQIAYNAERDTLYISDKDAGEILALALDQGFSDSSLAPVLSVTQPGPVASRGDALYFTTMKNTVSFYNLTTQQMYPGQSSLYDIMDVTVVHDDSCGGEEPGVGSDDGGSSTSGSSSGDSGTSGDGGSGDTGSGSGGTGDTGSSSGGGGSSGGDGDGGSSCLDGSVDSDSDGLPGCVPGCNEPCDDCDGNPRKFKDAGCGCDNNDTPTLDSSGSLVCSPNENIDNDLFKNNEELCPLDPLKSAPEVCGCGFPETPTCGPGDKGVVTPDTNLPAPVVVVRELGKKNKLEVSYLYNLKEIVMANNGELLAAKRRKRKSKERTVVYIEAKQVDLKGRRKTKIKRVKDTSEKLIGKTVTFKAKPDSVYVVNYKVGRERKKRRKNGKKRYRPIKSQQTQKSPNTTAVPTSLITR